MRSLRTDRVGMSYATFDGVSTTGGRAGVRMSVATLEHTLLMSSSTLVTKGARIRSSFGGSVIAVDDILDDSGVVASCSMIIDSDRTSASRRAGGPLLRTTQSSYVKEGVFMV